MCKIGQKECAESGLLMVMHREKTLPLVANLRESIIVMFLGTLKVMHGISSLREH